MRSILSRSGAAGLVGLLIAFSSAVKTQEIDNRSIYLVANQIADDIELVREVMGKPFDDSPRLPASEVSEHELFIQTQTLFRKSNQLAQEAGVAERQVPPAAASEEIQSTDIYRLLELATEQVLLVKNAFGITETLETLRRESGISNTGIFMTIIDVNRQLNLMLNDSIQASDMFDRVALVNVYAAGIITALSPDTPRLPLPAIEGHFRPSDVYTKLLECLDLVGRIARRVDGARVMSLSSRRNIPDDIEPGHVYDLAQILVADVATLAIALDALETPFLDHPVPDRIFPTQAYQRAELLLQQLELIEDLL